MSNSLIVDFPSSGRSNTASSKSVRFSPTIKVRYTRYPSEAENEAKSYSSDDYRRFKRVLVRDALKCSRRLESANKSGFQDRQTSEEHIIRCVGLDHLVSRNVSERYNSIREARRAHSRLVLQVQKWQLENNAVVPENLALVSMENSYSFKVRSQKVALLASYVE